MAVDIAARVLALGPRDLFNFDAAIPALDPAHEVAKEDGDVPEWDEREGAWSGHVVVSWGGFGAARAPGFAVGARDDLGDEGELFSFLAKGDFVVNESLERMDFVE